MNNLPDGLKTPALWQLVQWVAKPIDLMENCRQKYGDTFTLQFYKPFVFLSHPQAIQEIFAADTAKKCDSGSNNEILVPVVGTN